MLEAKIILPLEGNNGENIGRAHNYLRASLVANFGGVTVFSGIGHWRDETGETINEVVCAYVTAMKSTQGNNRKLRKLAIVAGREAGQKAVYVRYADGRVSIITL